MPFLQDLPLKRKLTLITMLTSGMALLIACGAFVSYERLTLKHELTRSLAITAEMIGFNCSASLSFGDNASAKKTLQGLSAEPHIVAACVYDDKGAVFTTYRRDDRSRTNWPKASANDEMIGRNSLEVFRKIDSAGEFIGTIYLESDLDEISLRTKRYAAIACVVLAFAILAAWMLASKLQRVISEPITLLAAITGRVAAEKDYSLRAAKRGNDEVGRLIDGFNNMLEQIQTRETALQGAYDHLEKRVEDRTAELANSLALLKQAQATAALDQARFKFIFESVPVGISLFTERGGKSTSRMINDAHLRICGLTREEAASPENFSRISHPDDYEKQQALTQKLQAGEIEQFSMEKRYVNMEGRVTWTVFSAQERLYPDGTVERLTTVVDVTELKRAQQQAAREQARFKFIFEALPVGISWFAPDKPETLLVNPAHENITGVSAEEAFKPGAFARVSHPDDYERQQKLTEAFLSGAIDRYSVEKRYFHRDGRIVWVVLTSRMFLDPATGERQAVTTLVDITERKLAEAGFAEASALLETLLEHSPDLIYFKDRESRFVRVSKSIVQRFGLSGADKLVGQSDATIHPQADDVQQYGLDEREIIRTGIPLVAKLEKETRPHGEISWILTTKVPWRDSSGAIVGTFGISRDITAAKKAELEIEQMHRKLLETSRQAGMAEVATGVLHNVGNVLNSVNVSITVLADHVRNSKTGNVAKLATLINQHEANLAAFFTDDSRGKMVPTYLETLADTLAAEQGTMTSELAHLRKNVEHINEVVAMQQTYATTLGFTEIVSITDVVEDALRINAGSFARHEVDTIRDYQARPVITTDRHKVMQILINLVRNAKHACDDSGRTDKKITVRTTSDDQEVQIAVLDNGVGIPEENLTRIFNHGFTTRKQGHGFGLHSCALSAKDIGGSIAVKSDGPGQGATFILRIPFKPGDPALD